MLRRFLMVLVFVFFVLLVLFPVLVGGYFVADAADDTLGFIVFRASVVVAMVLLVANVLMMVATVSLIQVSSRSDDQDHPS